MKNQSLFNLGVGILVTLCFQYSMSLNPPTPTYGYYCGKVVASDPNVRYEFCIRLFESDFNYANATLEELLQFSMKATLSNATNIHSYISKLLKNNKNLDRYSREALQDCSELYSTAKSKLHEAFYDVKCKDYFKANMDVSASMDSSDTCEDGFKDNKVTVSPLTNLNAVFFQLNAIVLSFINMFH